jgi:hypothetical protein
MRCAFCGHEGAPPADVASRLQAAAEVVARHQVSERQLHGTVRTLVLYGRVLQGAFGCLALLVLFPLLQMFGLFVLKWATAKRQDAPMAFGALALLPMAVIVCGVAIASFAVLRRAARRAEAASAAVPPEREGEPSRCHVCGAPLESKGVRGVVRCAYCAADNVLAARLVAGSSQRRLEVLDDYAAEVERESTAVTRTFGRGTVLFLTAVLLTPVLCVAPTFFVAVFVWAMGNVGQIFFATMRAPTPGNRYALVEVPDEGTCVAWWNPYTGRWERAGGPSDDDAIAVPAESAREIALAELVGRRVRIAVPGDRDRGFVGTSSDARASVYISRKQPDLVPGPDSVKVRAGTTSRYRSARAELWGVCLAETE